MADKKKAEDKNENRRLAALNFMAEAEKAQQEAARKAEDQARRREENRRREAQ